MGLGSALKGSSRYLSLAAAREKALEQHERIARDIDPLELKRADRAAQRQAEAMQHTFKQAAEACYDALEPGWSSVHHGNEFIRSLERYAFPIIGNDDIAGLDKHSVLRVLEQKLPSRIKGADGGTLWHQRTVTADRLRSRIERVISFAEARGWRPEGTPNPARWRGFLDLILAAPRKIAPVRHMRAVPYSEIPAVMAALAADPSVAAQALRFIVLTAARLGEAIKATWDEIDLDDKRMDGPEGANEEPARAPDAALAAGGRVASIALPRDRQSVSVHLHQDAGGRRGRKHVGHRAAQCRLHGDDPWFPIRL